MEQAWEGSLETCSKRDSGVEKWAACFLVRRQFRFITVGWTRGRQGRRMERHFCIHGDDPLYERPPDYNQCPRLNTCRQPKNISTNDALNHFVSILLTPFCLLMVFPALFYPFPPLYFTILSLTPDYTFVNLLGKHSLLAHSLLIYPHLFTQTHSMPSVPGVGRSSGAAGGCIVYWHTHYPAQGVPVVRKSQASFIIFCLLWSITPIAEMCLDWGSIKTTGNTNQVTSRTWGETSPHVISQSQNASAIGWQWCRLLEWWPVFCSFQ